MIWYCSYVRKLQLEFHAYDWSLIVISLYLKYSKHLAKYLTSGHILKISHIARVIVSDHKQRQ